MTRTTTYSIQQQRSWSWCQEPNLRTSNDLLVRTLVLLLTLVPQQHPKLVHPKQHPTAACASNHTHHSSLIIFSNSCLVCHFCPWLAMCHDDDACPHASCLRDVRQTDTSSSSDVSSDLPSPCLRHTRFPQILPATTVPGKKLGGLFPGRIVRSFYNFYPRERVHGGSNILHTW
jgi:hypothetical protein